MAERSRRRGLLWWASGLTVFSACADGAAPYQTFDSQGIDFATSGSEPGSGSESASETESASESESESESESASDRLDVEPDGARPGCRKIDLVFVIDNSASMYDEQQSLLASVPGFVAGIEDVLAGDDVHLMVIDTDVSPAAATCYEAIYNSFSCETWCDAHCTAGCACECNGEWCPGSTSLSCEESLGAGRTTNESGLDCGLAQERYIALGAGAEVESAFSCMAQVGVEGDGDERQARAVLDALGPLADGGGCNTGFLRDDALLIVTVISDEDDRRSLGEPADWYQELVDTKGGDPNAVVVLGLLGDSDLVDGKCEEFDPTDNSGSYPSERLRDWVDRFPYGAWASVCEPDYAPIFTQALEAIGAACEEFEPAG